MRSARRIGLAGGLRRFLPTAAVLAGLAACQTPEPRVPIRHPVAGSGVLGVNRASAESTFQRYRYDPRSEDERVHEAVLSIVTEYPGGIEYGSGIAYCQVGRSLFVLTARHVLTGEDGQEGPEAAPGFFADEVRVRFFRDAVPEIVGTPESFDARYVPGRDIALLRIELPSTLDRIDRVRLASAGRMAPGSRVRAIGYSMDRLSDWSSTAGELVRVSRELTYLPSVSAGFSGGPLLDEEAGVVGMNVRVTAQERTVAIPIGEIIDQVRAWTPAECPQVVR